MALPPPLTSTNIDGNINGGISIFLGVIKTALNAAEIVLLGKKGRQKEA